MTSIDHRRAVLIAFDGHPPMIPFSLFEIHRVRK